MAVSRGSGIQTPGGMTLDRRLGIAAVLILVFSFSALAYSILSMEGASDVVRINGIDYEWADLEANFTVVEMDGKSGVMLSDLINDTGLEDPAAHDYAIVGADGYRKTVEWDDMLNGILIVDDKAVHFSTLPKQYFVRDIVEIEVV